MSGAERRASHLASARGTVDLDALLNDGLEDEVDALFGAIDLERHAPENGGAVGRRMSLAGPGRRLNLASGNTSVFGGRLMSFNAQTGHDPALQRGMSLVEVEEFESQIATNLNAINTPFESKFQATEMRQLALVAHNHMKPAMRDFIELHGNLLKKFRITGTQTTMRMCKSLWGEDCEDVTYGLTCTSGPLGGDAQVSALLCMEDLGGLIFFVDPLTAHPHQADIESLIRLSNCHNISMCMNPTSAEGFMWTARHALIDGNRGMLPSFFETLESPSVPSYKAQQAITLHAVTEGINTKS